MVHQDKIPVLQRDAYHKVYFKEKFRSGSSLIPSSVQHIEVRGRCNTNATIQAHRLDFYAVFIVTRGKGVHRFGLKDHNIKENMLCFVGPDMISAWQSEEGEQCGYFCAFSADFFNLGREDKHFLNNLPFFRIDGNAVLHLTDAQTRYYLSLFNQMYLEFENKNEYSGNILRGQLQVLLHKAYSQYRLEEQVVKTPNHSGVRLWKAFTTLFMRDIKMLRAGKVIRLKKVADYADELGVSQNYLNDSIKALTGRSAGQLIKDQIIKQATMCLMNSSKSISEIAYVLGYDDPSYFSRYYKRHTGKSPSDFR